MIHFWFGADTYTLSRELAALKADFKIRFPGGIIEEISAMQAEDIMPRLRGALESQGLFGNEKLIVLRDFVSLAAKLAAEEKFLSERMESLPKDYELVFVEAGEADERRVFFKKLKKIAKAREFAMLEGKAYFDWIEKRAREEGFEFEKGALEKFPVFDLWQAASELEKLMLYKAEEKIITQKDTHLLVRPNIEENVFSLTNLFAEKRKSEAVRVLNTLLSDGPAYELKNQAIQIVGALAGQIRSLLLVKGLDEKTNDNIARELGWKTGRVWINRRLAAKFQEARLATMLRDLRAIDMRLKTSEEPPKLLLALFLQKAAA